MKVTIRDVNTLSALRPLEIAAYLRANQWQEQSVDPGRCAIWTRGKDYEIALPLDLEFGDFPQRMYDVLRTLELVEGRSQLEILDDLLTISADTLRVRLTQPDLSNGTIRIEQGAQIVQKARDLMMAGACAAVEPRQYYEPRKPALAVEYLRKVKLGQTERGSFVMTILSPVPPELRQDLSGVDQPFERRVTEILAASLAALGPAAQRASSTGCFDAFQKSVPIGVSSNLCEAVVGLTGAGETEHGVQIGFSWARTRPASTTALRLVTLSADSMPAIREAGRLFRETAPREEFELRGPVVKLERADARTTGKATVLGFVDGQPRKVRLHLSDADYHAAVQAHDSQQTIRCYGVLSREGRSYILQNPRGLTIEPDDE